MRMTRQEIIDAIPRALEEKQFVIYIQPQFNHSTKELIGGEALVRWIHPENGMQSPADFIPIFEEMKKIPVLDLFVFDRVCAYQRKCLDAKETCIPISFNISREDLLLPDYIDSMEKIRSQYDIPVQFLRAEITESSAVGGSEHIINIVNRFHELGYMVEMDDFGSGYSSLNVLKDLEVDIIKLDLKFFSGQVGGRGGTIISSVVNMAKWLNTPVIAEGVETREQADYMLSIGCEYIQGFYYSKPLPTDEFNKLFRERNSNSAFAKNRFIDRLDTGRFWSPESLETLIFSNYVGGAAIMLYDINNGHSEILRVNGKYLREIGMNQTEKDVISMNPWFHLDKDNIRIYKDTLKLAIETEDEQECETWRTYFSDCCGEDKICIRSSMQLIGIMENKHLFYIMIRNITKEKKLFNEVYASDQRFRAASEHSNIYAWEYNINTKEMRPCFRCMRDLNLPPLIKNYPEPLIEVGIFPSDYAEYYRKFMKKIDDGVGTIEAVIPLTTGRIPFKIKYTTEFDAGGKPVKAYGSAILLIGNDHELTDPTVDP